jgi:hypothetical protein
MTMKTRPALIALAAALAASGALAEDLVARGKYLVTTWKMGPNGPEPDMSRMLSGHPQDFKPGDAPKPQGGWSLSAAHTMTAWTGPWGTSYTANLTPDPETGIGRWTLRNFKDTIRTGRHHGRGRAILPPMPIPMYRNFNDADLEAIYAYLQSIPPVKNRVPEPLPPAVPVAAR